MLPYDILDLIVSYLDYYHTKIIFNADNDDFWKVKYIEDYGYKFTSEYTYEEKYQFMERYKELLNKVDILNINPDECCDLTYIYMAIFI